MKDILVFADGGGDVAPRIAAAWALAEQDGAHLEVYRPVTTPLAPYGLVIPSVEQAYRHVVSTEHAEAEKRLGEAVNSVAPLGPRLSAMAHSIPQARVREAAAIAARTVDLVVAGRPETGDRTHLDTELVIGALFGAGTPCLLLPRWMKRHDWGRRVLVAWKGTPEANRALHSALPFLARAEAVRLVVVNPREAWAGEDRRGLMRLATHLTRHGVKLEDPVTVETPDTLDHIVEQAIMGQAEEFNADCMVLGAYGHSRWGEVLLGGVSQAVIRNANVPILMAH